MADYYSFDDDSDYYVPSKKKVAPAAAPKRKAASTKTKTTGAKKAKTGKGPGSDEDRGSRADGPTSPLRTVSSANIAAGRAEGRTLEQIYQKKTQLEHILLRPDTYVGSVELTTAPMWVVNADGRLEQRTITYVPALFKIFDEILVNASDNKQRDASMDALKVEISAENNEISVWNNGNGIPVKMHGEYQCYIPELIFGQLLTGSNYDDKQAKVTGGRNGYGAKLTNIFSSSFTIETSDGESKYKQTFSKNMSEKGKPKVTAAKPGDNWTRVTFRPDLGKFGMTHLDDDIVSLMRKRVYDMAGCNSGTVKVSLNGKRVPIKTFKDYAKMHTASVSERPAPVYKRINDRWEVAVTYSDGSFQQVSFVNSICTSKGGKHVDHVTDQIVKQLSEVLGKGKKGVKLRPAQIRNHLWVFVNALIVNPAFDSQTKETLTTRSTSFGSKCPLPEDFTKQVLNCGILESVRSFAEFQQSKELKKSDGSKKMRVNGILKLDDANDAGGKNADKCTLILTEGDSAKALAVSGLSVIGRDRYGVFPLRGKLLNVREASHKQLLDNKEINELKKIMGLQSGRKYDSTRSLRYGSIMIMSDQDADGSHIKGLVINFLHHFWPDLVKNHGFVKEFITPIIKVTKGKQEISFFTIPEYQSWKEAHNDGRGWKIKYYKGLGTSTRAEAKEYFSNLERHQIDFSFRSDADDQAVELAFSKKKIAERKEWLRNFKPGTFINHDVDSISIDDFVNKELILFSMADNVRSIPSLVDGLKPGQRKILFAAFKRKLKDELKVAQLAGYVAEHAAYHHGEQSLASTIIGMAQNFCGSNNIALLQPCGQFGTRLQGGKDAASARYIFTRLAKMARLLFHEHDDALLAYLDDDGQSIEPTWYCPIIPMVLVNGADGIGTGWSTSVPTYDPRDIVEALLAKMDGSAVPEMRPWFRAFTGAVTPNPGNAYSFLVYGRVYKTNSTTLEITELPYRTWTQTYKEFLESLLVAGGPGKEPVIKDYKEYHTDVTVRFVLTLSEASMARVEKEGLYKVFKLTNSVTTSNMHLFDAKGRICRYESVEDILEEFYDVRMRLYEKRKIWLADQLTKDWNRLDNRVRFIEAVIARKLVVSNRKKADLMRDMRTLGLEEIHSGGKSKNSGDSDDDDADDQGDAAVAASGKGFDYLLSMPMWSLTKERVEKLKAEREAKHAELNDVLATPAMTMWRRDLDAFLAAFEAYEETEVEAASSSQRGVAKKGKGTKAGKSAKAATAPPMPSSTAYVTPPTPVAPTKRAAKRTAAARAVPITLDSPMKLAAPSFPSPPPSPVTTARPVSKPAAGVKRGAGTTKAKAKTKAKAVEVMTISDDDDDEADSDDGTDDDDDDDVFAAAPRRRAVRAAAAKPVRKQRISLLSDESDESDDDDDDDDDDVFDDDDDDDEFDDDFDDDDFDD